jgi:LacI family transcriptional regulator
VIPQTPDEPEIDPVKYVVEKGLADGIILTSTRANDERVKYLNEQQVPFVTFGRTELATQHPWYDVDNADFVYQAARYLYLKGRKNLILLTPDTEYLYGWHRLTGFRRAALEFGYDISDDANILVESTTNDHQAFVEDAAKRETPPDGYICGTEISALSVSSTLQKLGIMPGKDVEVITMEASRLAEFYHPPLTAFTQDLHRAGRMLSTLLLRSIDGEPAHKLQILDKVTMTKRG